MNRLKWLIYYMVVFIIVMGQLQAQTAFQADFTETPRSYTRYATSMHVKEDTLMKQFAEKGLEWPAKQIYIRSFKYDSHLEVWVRQQRSDSFKLFKTYKVCALAGTLGPKRMEGDYQVPEGFYHINEFNPKSEFHLSLGLNYPNASDRFLSDSLQPGGDIFIHGSCVTTGCIPITDAQIEELYILATYAKNNGLDFIPVHIFPISFKNKKSADYHEKHLKDFPENEHLHAQMKAVYYYFNKYKQLPVIMVNNRGEYVVDEEVLKSVVVLPLVKNEKVAVVKKNRVNNSFNEKDIPTAVNKLPVYPGGPQAFQDYIGKLGQSLAVYLDEGQKTTYVQVEYIITKEGKVINPKVIRGGNDVLNEKLLDAFEAMPVWTPAIRNNRFDEVPVPVKLKQTVVVDNQRP